MSDGTVEVDREYHEALVATALFRHGQGERVHELTPGEAERQLQRAGLL